MINCLKIEISKFEALYHSHPFQVSSYPPNFSFHSSFKSSVFFFLLPHPYLPLLDSRPPTPLTHSIQQCQNNYSKKTLLPCSKTFYHIQEKSKLLSIAIYNLPNHLSSSLLYHLYDIIYYFPK